MIIGICNNNIASLLGLLDIKFSFLTKLLFLIAIIYTIMVYVVGANPFRISWFRPLVLSCSFSLLAIVAIITLHYNPNTVAYVGVIYCKHFYLFNSPIIFGFDGLSLAFVLLTTLIIPYCIISSWDLDNSNRCIFLIFLIELFLILTFTSIDLFWFYFFFESTIAPIVYIIIKWGSNARKQKALFYYFGYSIFGSFIILLGISAYYVEFGTTSVLYTFLIPLQTKGLIISTSREIIIWLPLILGFITKIPILPFTLWLPEAHVEAPTCGSIILAGLLLKVGGYGIVKFLLPFTKAQAAFQPILIGVCLVGAFFAAAAAVVQKDIKRLVAYASIVHINLALIGVFTLTKIGGIGGLITMFGHGIVSVGLFYLIGVLYTRHHTRLFYYFSNVSTYMPLFSVFLVVFLLANTSFPLTINFLGELMVIIGVVKKNIWLCLAVIAVILLLNLLYSLIIIQRVLYGSYESIIIKKYEDLTQIEFIVLTHLTVVNTYFFICPRLLISIFSPFFAYRFLKV